MSTCSQCGNSCWINYDGASYCASCNPDIADKAIDEAPRPPWFLESLGDGYQGVGRIMHLLETSSYRHGKSAGSRLINAAAGPLQIMEQALGQVLLGEVQGKENDALQNLHSMLEAHTRGKVSRESVISFMQSSKLLRSVGFALWQGHIRGLQNVQQQLAKEGRGVVFFNRIYADLKARDEGSSDPTTVEAVITLHQTAPDETRNLINATLSADQYWQAAADQVREGSLACILPAEFEGQALIENATYAQSPEVYSNRALERFSSIIEGTTIGRLNAYINEGQQATLEGQVATFKRGVEAVI
ncbi:hypothetical protein A3H78_01090 [Candidatus Roizmanbacteria bacterium RIFCSPLOWO2_02_FULL_36_11]|uniref:Uncharacterized protein n=1 Tax=Candidatus Roizmanbacteria bacterium RIFCSPLOWO2_02_FULL_36_11 TaxID=1802071 RepID=A0A1F7JIJ6_9BACT|nr:MAG: hypothetical protein A3H78_01090 [Candidatus Roizmanbacteria bacterium RIFCSPLOWO2_02_FULL_36_11]